MDPYFGLPGLTHGPLQVLNLLLEPTVLADFLVILPIHVVIVLLGLPIEYTQNTYKSVDLEDSLSTSSSIGSSIVQLTFIEWWWALFFDIFAGSSFALLFFWFKFIFLYTGLHYIGIYLSLAHSTRSDCLE